MAYQVDFCVFVVNLLIRKTTMAYHRKRQTERSGGFSTQSTTINHTETSHWQVGQVPGKPLHITAEYSADIRKRTPWARVSVHIRNQKFQASTKKINECHKLVSRRDRVRNEEVRRRAGIERELASRADQRVLRWFGHVERMDDCRMARRVLMGTGPYWGRVRGRPGLG